MVLSSSAFATWWLFLVLVHAVCAIFLIACGCLYWFMEEPYLSYYADLLADPKQRHFKTCGTILIMLGAVHCIEFVALIAVTARSRKPALPSSGFLDLILLLIKRFVVRPYLVSPAEGPRLKQARLMKLHAALESCIDLLSVESKHFWVVYTVRALAVVASQVLQSYNFSNQIARPWINSAFVAIVVTNCFSIALLYFTLRHYDSSSQQSRIRSLVKVGTKGLTLTNARFSRMLCHVIDCLLTSGTAMVLPLAVVMPYVAQFDRTTYDFDDAVVYGDTAFPNLVRENQLLFARTFWDIGMKVMPHLSIYMCLSVIVSLLRTRIEPAMSIKLTVPTSATQQAIQTTTPLRKSHGPAIHKHAKLDKVTQVKRVVVTSALLSLGFTVLALHTRAYALSTRLARSSGVASMCAQRTYPWFSSRFSCAVVKFSCYHHGVHTPPDDAFDNFEPDSVVLVILKHCPALVVPSAIQSFSNILGIDMYNCTIVKWGVDAALAADLHPNMVFVTIARVNMTEVPAGLLQSPLPEKLKDIEFSTTNLTTLPSTLHEVWAGVDTLFFEHSQLTEIPETLLAIPALSEVSFIGNSIISVPDSFEAVVQTDNFYALSLALNPIRSLPQSIPAGLTFGFLSLEHTSVTVLPSWATERITESLYLFGTPLCESEEQTTVIQTACSQRDDVGDGRYPLAVIDPMRQL